VESDIPDTEGDEIVKSLGNRAICIATLALTVSCAVAFQKGISPNQPETHRGRRYIWDGDPVRSHWIRVVKIQPESLEKAIWLLNNSNVKTAATTFKQSKISIIWVKRERVKEAIQLLKERRKTDHLVLQFVGNWLMPIQLWEETKPQDRS
jgi:hypothetical protein